MGGYIAPKRPPPIIPFPVGVLKMGKGAKDFRERVLGHFLRWSPTKPINGRERFGKFQLW